MPNPQGLHSVLPGVPGPVTAAALRDVLNSSDPSEAERVVAEIRRLTVLSQVAATVTQHLSLDQMLPRLMELITETLDADRATLFLRDPDTGELFSRVLRGEGLTEIRIPPTAGIAGSVFTSGVAEIVPDAYQDVRFNQEIDRRSGYHTRNMVSVPLRNRDGEVIGVTQVLNRRDGVFTVADIEVVEQINNHAANALEQSLLVEKLEQTQREEDEMLAVAEAISTELHLDTLFARIMAAATDLLRAERSTLFVYDQSKDELWSKVAEGTDLKEIRIPSNAGLAGAAFTSGEVLNIPDAYADPRFNREIDRQSGYRTRNMLVFPIRDKLGDRLGVVQALNKRGGPFGARDIRLLGAFCSQIAIAIQNAQLFSDVLYLKNYNESILRSLSNGVVTLDKELKIVKVNEAGQRILGVTEEELMGRPALQVFGNQNAWVTRSLDYVARLGSSDYHADTDYMLPSGDTAALNLTTTPLLGGDNTAIGYMLVFEDITREKRVRNTMARYVAKEVVDQMLVNGEDFLQGSSRLATVLFADIRHFTTIAESMTPRDTVTMLNEYFTAMVDVIFNHGGMLDKYIGDALMAVFGSLVQDVADAENAVAVATEMIRELRVFNAKRAEIGEAPIEIGVGVATGEVVAGSLGSRRRLEYTVIGDNVNLASRLESANKYFGTSVLLSSSTAEALRNPTALRRLDFIKVRGKSRPTLVYESMAHHTPATLPGVGALIKAYESGLDQYQQRNWDTALSRFADALEICPTDGPSRIFTDRCRYYRAHPPTDDWEGVWIMQEK